MNIVVGIICLVTVALLEEVTGIPKPNQSDKVNKLTCRRWCKKPNDRLYCCETSNKPDCPVVADRPGKCPAFRLTCTVNRDFAPPDQCSNDGCCTGDDKCCWDTCLDHHTCKAPSTEILTIDVRSPTIGCNFNGKSYQDNDQIDDSCLVMKCSSGEWEYTGHIRKECGDCTVYGDPHFCTFDKNDFLKNSSCYEFGKEGDFVITQQGYDHPSLFGVNSAFKRCNAAYKPGLSCIQSIRYFEPGMTVDFILPTINDDDYPYCTRTDVDPITDPMCQIKVLVRNITLPNTESVEAFQVTDGEVLVFNHNHIESEANIICMNVVGSKGLSVSLCQHEGNFAYLYILALPSLKSQQSQLYGLCNTFTGSTRDGFTILDGYGTTSKDLFTYSWAC